MCVFDTSSFIVIGHYFPERVPSFWEHMDVYVADGRIISVREVRRELDPMITREHMDQWLQVNGGIFKTPTEAEMGFVAQVFRVPEFQTLVRRKQILSGSPAADPFVIAAAQVRGGCVVTEESRRENAIRIPNVCDHFGADCANIEGFMERENWQY